MGVRTYPDVPRVYIDMDGPVADFDSALQASGLPVKDFKCQRGVFRSLPLTPLALDSIATLEAMGVLVFLLTKIPLSNPFAATEKLLFVDNVIPHLLDRVIISPDKGAVGTTNDFLIDDHPEWANANNFRGTILLWKHNWPDIVARIRATLAQRKLAADADQGLPRIQQECTDINDLLSASLSPLRASLVHSPGGPYLALLNDSKLNEKGDPKIEATLPVCTEAGVVATCLGLPADTSSYVIAALAQIGRYYGQKAKAAPVIP